MDSGAARSVASPSHFPGVVVRPSAGSRSGQKFVGAGKGSEGIPNLGQMDCQMVVETGDVGNMNLDAAEVRKPLLAVSSCNNKGNPVWFDGHKSCIIPGTAAQVKQIRALIAKITQRIPLHYKNGTYHMKTWRKASSRPFQGPE